MDASGRNCVLLRRIMAHGQAFRLGSSPASLTSSVSGNCRGKHPNGCSYPSRSSIERPGPSSETEAPALAHTSVGQGRARDTISARIVDNSRSWTCQAGPGRAPSSMEIGGIVCGRLCRSARRQDTWMTRGSSFSGHGTGARGSRLSQGGLELSAFPCSGVKSGSGKGPASTRIEAARDRSRGRGDGKRSIGGQGGVKHTIGGQGEVKGRIGGQGEVKGRIRGRGEVKGRIGGQGDVKGRMGGHGNGRWEHSARDTKIVAEGCASQRLLACSLAAGLALTMACPDAADAALLTPLGPSPSFSPVACQAAGHGYRAVPQAISSASSTMFPSGILGQEPACRAGGDMGVPVGAPRPKARDAYHKRERHQSTTGKLSKRGALTWQDDDEEYRSGVLRSSSNGYAAMGIDSLREPISAPGSPGSLGFLSAPYRTGPWASSRHSALPAGASMGGAAVTAGRTALLDWAVFRMALEASMKLFMICCFVVALMKTRLLPESTPSVLSQVAFKVLIPCFLLTKVSLTISAPQASPVLFMLPLVALCQVMAGAVMGKLAYKLAYETSVPESLRQAVENVGLGSWLPARAPAQADRELDPSVVAAEKEREKVITAACAFGNSVALPLVYLQGVLGSAAADEVAGYLALFMVGWSPALWTIGYHIIAGSDEGEASRGDSDAAASSSGLPPWLHQAKRTFLQVINPPLIGIFLGLLIGGTPLRDYFLPTSEIQGVYSPFGIAEYLSTAVLKPTFDAASFLGSASVVIQTVVLSASLSKAVPAIPWDSIPEWRAKTRVAWDSSIRSLQGLGKAGARDTTPSLVGPGPVPILATNDEVARRLQSGGIASSSSRGFLDMDASQQRFAPADVLLAAGEGPAANGPVAASSSPASLAVVPQPPAVASGAVLTPETILDGKAFGVICAVRMIALPAIGTSSILSLAKAGIIPNHPLCVLLLLVQMCMPSAQNLVLLSQLHERTKTLATVLASFMLKQYALSVIPITIWMSVFLSLAAV